MIEMKLVVLTLLTTFLFYVAKTLLLGRQIADRGRIEALLLEHRTSAREVLWISFALILSLLMLHLLPSARPVPAWLLTLHLLFAVPCLVTLVVMKFWYTGIRSSPVHAWLAFAIIILGSGMLLTGLPMLYLA